MRHPTNTTLAGAVLAATFILLPAPAAAQQVSFTIHGEMINNGQGYTQGTPVSFTWVLDAAAPPLARISEPGVGCCSGYIGWTQDLFSSSPQLWSSISGTGLSGAWLPPTDQDSGSLGLTLGDFPLPYSARMDLAASSQLGSPSGLLVNGHTVWAVQVQASFIGLDALGAYGSGAFFNVPVSSLPDATAMFLGLAGTYPADTGFTTFGSIWGNAPTGPSQARFRVDQLTISTAVPEPGTTALWLAGGVGLLLLSLRRQRAAEQGGSERPSKSAAERLENGEGTRKQTVAVHPVVEQAHHHAGAQQNSPDEPGLFVVSDPIDQSACFLRNAGISISSMPLLASASTLAAACVRFVRQTLGVFMPS